MVKRIDLIDYNNNIITYSDSERAYALLINDKGIKASIEFQSSEHGIDRPKYIINKISQTVSGIYVAISFIDNANHTKLEVWRICELHAVQ